MKTTMTKLYLFSKSIHRYLVVVISILTLPMAGTGVVLKFPESANTLRLDIGLARYIHSNLSALFTIALVLMMLSGIVMYLFPILKKK